MLRYIKTAASESDGTHEIDSLTLYTQASKRLYKRDTQIPRHVAM